MTRKPLPLIAQLPQLPHVDPAERRPAAEEQRHALVASLPCCRDLLLVEVREVSRQVVDHEPVPYGMRTGLLASPNHLRILSARLRRTCMSHLTSAALGAMATAVKAEERLRAFILAVSGVTQLRQSEVVPCWYTARSFRRCTHSELRQV